jgi:opacity protein-like surface antigen
MRKLLIVIGLVLMVSSAAIAQDAPKAEVSGGYEYVRISGGGGGAPSLNCHGGNGTLTVYPSKWFGLTADIGACRATISGVTGTAFSYVFGPKIAFRSSSRATPFVEALFGGARLSGGGSSTNGFAMAIGGGLDVKAGNHFAIRIAQGDYVMTRFSGVRTNNFRFAAGIVFLIGNK